MTQTVDNPEVLRMEGITKRFPGVIANDDISIDVRAGEVHALLGENGAGKSTLMKVLYGLLQPDRGEIFLHGGRIHISSPRAAVEHGIGMVHQHFMLVPNLTAVENVMLGLPRHPLSVLDRAGASRRLRELSEEYYLGVEPNAVVENLSVGAQQRLEILKLLFRNVRLLVLDEPTSVLAPAEVEQLVRMVRMLAGEGRAIIFISHKLEEVKEVSDRVTVLRDGRVVATCPTDEPSSADLAQMMVGRPITIGRRLGGRASESAATELQLENVTGLGDHGVPALVNVSLEVHAGEIMGVAGVDGNGQRELAECIAGLRRIESGRVLVGGRAVEGQTRDLKLLGFIPEDRQRTGLILSFSIGENLVLKSFDSAPFTRRGLLRWRAIWEHARRLMSELRMRRTDPTIPVAELSGGNQQRVMVGRELQRDPKVVIASQATRGLDIGAVENVHAMLIAQKNRGAAVLFISTELNEVIAISDRIVVLYRGEIMGEVWPEEVTIEEIGQMMLGRRRAEVT
jgi:general nucleoside transport system ATP-binding protein